MAKIIYYAPTSGMGETSEEDAEKYREWAQKELQAKFPDFDTEVSDQENINSFWTNIDDIQTNDRIEMVLSNLWDYCPWDWVNGFRSETEFRKFRKAKAEASKSHSSVDERSTK